jgi:predicted O-methyltransferase YrrM
MKTYEEKKKIIQSITSAWSGHYNFAEWLVKETKPSTIVELGVDYGFSLFTFASQQIGTVYGIDCFAGDQQTSFRNTEEFVLEKLKETEINNVVLIKDYFSLANKRWVKPIDILHIDGLHTYEAVKEDYENWSKFVKDDGVILLHDTCIYGGDFGVWKLFEGIQLPKVNFQHSAGLGVISKDINVISKISNACMFGEYDCKNIQIFPIKT